MNLKKYIFCVLALVTLLVAGGCDPQSGNIPETVPSSSAVSSESSSPGSGVPAAPKPAEPRELTVRVYYPNDDGSRLVAVSRKVKPEGGTDKYTAVMRSLMLGTKEKGQSTIIPRQTKLRSVKVQGGVAKVDLSGDLVKHFVGGSTGEEMLVGSIVNTLTEFPEVKSVQILIDGNPVESLAGHMDLTMPLKRMESILPK